MLRPDQVLLSLWKSGAFRAASYDPAWARGALVEHDGARTMRVVGVTRDGFEETVATSHAVPGGVQVCVSTLRGHGDGTLEWRWQVTRPRLRREERITIDPRGNVRFRQTDRRPDRITTFRSAGDGRYYGVTTTRAGDVRSTSEWVRDERGGLTGLFAGAGGEHAGGMHIPGREQRAAGEPVAWTGPESKGSISYDENDRPAKSAVANQNGERTHTWDQGGGYSVENGSTPGRSWIKITTPKRDSPGDSMWVEMGTEVDPKTGNSSEYTINGVQHADGSNSWSRIDFNSPNGDKGTTFGAADAQGNRSYSERIEHKDGSVTITIRTVDNKGNGTEQKINVDKNGKVTGDVTLPVKGGVTQKGGLATPGTRRPGTSTTNTDEEESEESEQEEDEPESDDDDSSDSDDDDDDDSDEDDSDDADDSDEPDSPDDGGDDGRDNPDGSDDGRPTIPWGKLGYAGGDFSDGFAGLRDLASGGGDDDETRGPRRIGDLRRTLGEEIELIVSGQWRTGGGSGADETGWGNGGEWFDGPPLVSGNAAWHPTGADDSGWGDTTDPRMLVALVQRFAVAASPLTRSGVLAAALNG